MLAYHCKILNLRKISMKIKCQLTTSIATLLLFLIAPNLVYSKEDLTVEQAFIKCKQVYPSELEAKNRHDCFDSITMPSLELAKDSPTDTANQNIKQEEVADQPVLPAASATISKPPTYLERKWRLSSTHDWGIADLETHHLNYLTVTTTSNTNDIATTPTRPNNLDRDLQDADLKFQISLKTELADNIPLIRDLPYVTSSRAWLAYTQQSYWQVFNSAQSRPMREHNFEPEIILSLGLDDKMGGEEKTYLPRMINLGVIHESNGRSNPVSRSWNRLYLEGAWELSDNLSLSLRPWWRIPDRSRNDDNPDIQKFLGYGDLKLHWDEFMRNTSASLLLRNNLRSSNKSYAKLDLQYKPLKSNNIKLHFMLSDGYGDSLLDYNHSQTVWGLGLSIGE